MALQFLLLQEIGYRTTLACDAEQALSVLEETAGAYDIMFSDVVMPGMNGIELGRKSGARTRTCRSCSGRDTARR